LRNCSSQSRRQLRQLIEASARGYLDGIRRKACPSCEVGERNVNATVFSAAGMQYSGGANMHLVSAEFEFQSPLPNCLEARAPSKAVPARGHAVASQNGSTFFV